MSNTTNGHSTLQSRRMLTGMLIQHKKCWTATLQWDAKTYFQIVVPIAHVPIFKSIVPIFKPIIHVLIYKEL